MFSGGIKRDQWHEMGYLDVINEITKFHGYIHDAYNLYPF